MIRWNVCLCVVLFLLNGFVCLSGAIPASERAALIAFYNAAGGESWIPGNGWKAEPLEADGFAAAGTEGNWLGVTVEADHVVKLCIRKNKVRGFLAPETGNLSHLEHLTVRDSLLPWHPLVSGLGGKIPPELGKLSALKILDLSSNHFSGKIPPELGNLEGLETLLLNYNVLEGAIPPQIGNLRSLKELNLGSNPLGCPIPPKIGHLENLESLGMFLCSLTGSIPAELGNLEKLHGLMLGNNRLSGPVPSSLENLVQLRELYLAHNGLSGSIEFACKLTGLESLSLQGNKFSDLPPGLGNLSQLRSLNVSSNRFSGSIPPGIGNLTELSSLRLGYNQFSGNIPEELGNLTKLCSISLNSNQLAGEIPSTFTRLKKLNYCDLKRNGFYSTDAAVHSMLNTIAPGWELTQTVAPAKVTAVNLPGNSIKLSWTPIEFTKYTGGYYVFYKDNPSVPWTYAGKSEDKKASSFTVTGLIPGGRYFFMVKTRTDANRENVNTVTSEASNTASIITPGISPGEDRPPFGSMDLPTGGEVYRGSMPVCGWALDDVEVAAVNVYLLRDGQRLNLGGAVFIEGARPDIEELYPGYPNHHKAGWGYMLLTNFLPGGGNGSYRLQTVAVDSRGHEQVLGDKTIQCDNANAINPFGTIDFPAQGETVSGADYMNAGWALAPSPNRIPTDGSTMDVYVDSVRWGSVVYNVYREDVAGLFPGYANSDGAGGYFNLDTTQLTDGVHTIAWVAGDEAGNASGIGSRFFTVRNTNMSAEMRTGESAFPGRDSTAPVAAGSPVISPMEFFLDRSTPVVVGTGFGTHLDTGSFYPGDDGWTWVTVALGQRILLYLGGDGGGEPGPRNVYTAALQVGSQLRPLPAGSALDREKGVFSWLPAAGFLGEYRLVFLEEAPGGNKKRRQVLLRVKPE